MKILEEGKAFELGTRFLNLCILSDRTDSEQLEIGGISTVFDVTPATQPSTLTRTSYSSAMALLYVTTAPTVAVIAETRSRTSQSLPVTRLSAPTASSVGIVKERSKTYDMRAHRKVSFAWIVMRH